MSENLENSAVATGLEKVSFHSNAKEGNVKECSNYHTDAFISHSSKVMLKILQARLKQYVKSNGQHPLDHRKSKRIPEEHLLPLH